MSFPGLDNFTTGGHRCHRAGSFHGCGKPTVTRFALKGNACRANDHIAPTAALDPDVFIAHETYVSLPCWLKSYQVVKSKALADQLSLSLCSIHPRNVRTHPYG